MARAALLSRSLATASILALTVAVGTAGMAQAADAIVYEPAPAAEMPASPFDLTFSLAGVTDYRFRGISQTDRDPALQATVTATYSIFYAGAFVSNVDFGIPDPDLEIDVFAGIRPEFGGVTFDLGIIGYIYPDEPVDTDYLEIKAAASYDFDVFSLTGSAYYSPDFAQADVEALYVEAAAVVPLPYDFSLSGAIGHQSFEEGFLDDYLTWNAGVSYTLDELVTFDVRYIDSDLDEGQFCTGTFHCGSTVVASVTVGTSLSALRERFAR